MPKRTDLKSILIIGAGPIVIGQACEFDYSGTQACKALKEEGYRVILVNSNPATIMTDPEFADVTYIEPLTIEFLEKIIATERPSALLPTLGGQTALNLSMDLHHKGILTKYGVEMIGAKPEAIAKGEDRELFKKAMLRIGLDVARSRTVKSLEEARAAADELGMFPLIIRPSFTLGGAGGGIAYNREEFERIVASGLDLSPVHEVLVEECLLGWKEYEMEVMRDHKDQCVVICSIENFDPMGVHTGDSITVAPSMTLTDKTLEDLERRRLNITIIRQNSMLENADKMIRDGEREFARFYQHCEHLKKKVGPMDEKRKAQLDAEYWVDKLKAQAAADLACTGSRAPAWLAASGLPVQVGTGRVLTDASLVVQGCERLFASGDCAVIATDPRPPAGVWAVRAAPVLAENLRRLQEQPQLPLRRWRPQRWALQLLGDGGGLTRQPRALAFWGPWAFGPSPLLWRWKHHLDQRFMARFSSLKAMDQGRASPMACRGCAAKLASSPLQDALARNGLGGSTPGSAEDAAVIGQTLEGSHLLQSVDGFPALVDDAWLNARLTTLHACSDLWACGARVTTVQAVVTRSEERRVGKECVSTCRSRWSPYH